MACEGNGASCVASSKRRNSSSTCIYCGEVGPTTSEYVCALCLHGHMLIRWGPGYAPCPCAANQSFFDQAIHSRSQKAEQAKDKACKLMRSGLYNVTPHPPPPPPPQPSSTSATEPPPPQQTAQHSLQIDQQDDDNTSRHIEKH